MNIEKIAKYVTFILSQYDPKTILQTPPAHPFVVFKKLFEHFCRTAEPDRKPSDPRMLPIVSVKHDDFFDCRVDVVNLEQLQAYLSTKLQIPVEELQLQDEISRLNALLRYLANYLRQYYEEKKLPVDVECDFYAMMIAFIYVYGRSLDLSCVPQLAADTSRYAQSKCNLKFIEGHVDGENSAKFNLPLFMYAEELEKVTIPRLNDSEYPHVRLNGLTELLRMSKVPQGLSEKILLRLLDLLNSSNDFLVQLKVSNDLPDNSKEYPYSKNSIWAAKEHLSYIFRIICSGAISISDSHANAVIKVLLAELSKEDSDYRYEICCNISNVPIPLAYRAQVTKVLLSIMNLPTKDHPNSGSHIYLIRAACISLSKIVIPEELRTIVLAKLTIACDKEELLLEAVVALQRLNAPKEIQDANLIKILDLVRKIGQLVADRIDLAELRSPNKTDKFTSLLNTLRMMTIPEEAKAQVINILVEKMQGLVALKAQTLACICLILDNVAPRSNQLESACDALLRELTPPQHVYEGVKPIVPPCLHVLYKLDHNLASQQRLLSFVIDIWFKNPHILDLFLHAEDLFCHLAPKYQATLLAYLEENKSSDGFVLAYWNILYRDVPTSEVLELRQQKDDREQSNSFLSLLPANILLNTMRRHGP